MALMLYISPRLSLRLISSLLGQTLGDSCALKGQITCYISTMYERICIQSFHYRLRIGCLSEVRRKGIIYDSEDIGTHITRQLAYKHGVQRNFKSH